MANLFDDYVIALQAEFPKFKIVEKKTSKLMQFFNFFAKLWTPTFLTNITTVIGTTVYMPKWLMSTDSGYVVLRHEAVHMRDTKKWSILMGITYFIPPVGPSMKAIWEFRGYMETLRVWHELGWYTNGQEIDWLVSQFTGPAYLWMWPFKASLTKKFRAEFDRLNASVPP
jgi:hypothetical protein